MAPTVERTLGTCVWEQILEQVVDRLRYTAHGIAELDDDAWISYNGAARAEEVLRGLASVVGMPAPSEEETEKKAERTLTRSGGCIEVAGLGALEPSRAREERERAEAALRYRRRRFGLGKAAQPA